MKAMILILFMPLVGDQTAVADNDFNCRWLGDQTAVAENLLQLPLVGRPDGGYRKPTSVAVGRETRRRLP